MIMRSSPFTVEFLGTPEAGKTTTITLLEDELKKITNVSILQESAEIVPEIFRSNEYKKSMEAHLWMRLTMAAEMLRQQCNGKPEDILLADRGIIDAFCWNYYFADNKLLNNSTVMHFKLLLERICEMPNLIVYLTTTPEEAIRRRGGEGKIVTYDFVDTFQSALNSFLKYSTIPVFHLDTTCMSKKDVVDSVCEKIIVSYNNAK